MDNYFIKQHISLVSVVGKVVSLTKKGNKWVGLCPFHDDTNPSLWVNEDKKMYHCFSCKESGDIFTFLMKTQHISFKDAVLRLCKEYNLPVSDIVESNTRFYTILDVFRKFFCSCLQSAPHALRFLQDRGISADTILKFRIGYSPDVQMFQNFVRTHGFDLKDLYYLSLTASEDKDLPFYRNRIMFPISNKKNQVLAFGSRSVGNDLSLKYLHARDGFFVKKTAIYGLYEAIQCLKQNPSNDYLLCCEGYMDVLSVSQAGIGNVIALLGTSVTREQISGLFKIRDHIIVCFDSDDAGRKASERISYLSLSIIGPGQSMRFVSLPMGLDPDDFTRLHMPKDKSKDKWYFLINNAQLLCEFVLKTVLQKHAKGLRCGLAPEVLAAVEIDLMKLISENDNLAVVNHYKRWVRKSLYSLSSNSKGKTIWGARNVSDYCSENNSSVLAEKMLILLIKHPELLQQCREYVDSLVFADVFLNYVLNLLKENTPLEDILQYLKENADVISVRRFRLRLQNSRQVTAPPNKVLDYWHALQNAYDQGLTTTDPFVDAVNSDNLELARKILDMRGKVA